MKPLGVMKKGRYETGCLGVSVRRTVSIDTTNRVLRSFSAEDVIDRHHEPGVEEFSAEDVIDRHHEGVSASKKERGSWVTAL